MYIKNTNNNMKNFIVKNDFNNPIVKANTFYAQLKIITFKVNYILNFDVLSPNLM